MPDHSSSRNSIHRDWFLRQDHNERDALTVLSSTSKWLPLPARSNVRPVRPFETPPAFVGTSKIIIMKREKKKKISSRVAAFLCWPYHLLRIQLREDGGDRRKKENRKGEKKENILDAFAFSVALLAGVSSLLRCRIRVREKPISTSILFFFSSMLIRCLLEMRSNEQIWI